MPKPANPERAEHLIPGDRGVLWVDVAKLPPGEDDGPSDCRPGAVNDPLCALIVDDDQFYRTAIGNALRNRPFDILEATSYSNALAVCDSNCDRIHLLITAIALPDGNGCSLAVAIRKWRPDLRVLFVSFNVGMEGCKYYGLKLPSLYVLKKPFTAAQLRNRIRRILEADQPFPYMHVAAASAQSA
jgi:DNA-binding response OmpR family regulator